MKHALHPFLPAGDPHLAPALHAVQTAARITRDAYDRPRTPHTIVKPDGSPVTAADFAAQAVIAALLARELGEITLVGEESGADLRANADLRAAALEIARDALPDITEPALVDAVDLGDRLPPTGPDHPPFWTLDPIDGTRGYIARQQYSIALARIERGRPVLAILACPAMPIDLDEPLDTAAAGLGPTYLAAEGTGAFEIDHTAEAAEPVPIAHIGFDPADGTLAVTASLRGTTGQPGAAERAAAWLAEHRGIPIGEPIRIDSQCKYAVVARGQADAFLRGETTPGRQCIWDHAAGALLAAEAGCTVSDTDGLPLDFSRGRTLAANRGILCAPPDLHAMLLEAIPSVRRTAPRAR